jgi:hypothetical protein
MRKLKVLPIGLIVAFISSLILKKKPNEEATSKTWNKVFKQEQSTGVHQGKVTAF